MDKQVLEWLVFAEKDLLTVEKLLNDELLTNISAFHSHQCIEKLFKAVILHHTKKIPRLHNLLRLYGTVRNYIKLDIEMLFLEEVNETYTDARYPSDLGLMPNGSLSIEKASSFYTNTKHVFDQISLKLETI